MHSRPMKIMFLFFVESHIILKKKQFNTFPSTCSFEVWMNLFRIQDHQWKPRTIRLKTRRSRLFSFLIYLLILHFMLMKCFRIWKNSNKDVQFLFCYVWCNNSRLITRFCLKMAPFYYGFNYIINNVKYYGEF